MSTTLIWDKLPDCIIDKIYRYIYYKQPTILLDDIKNYNFTINYIENYIYNNYNEELNILWIIIINFEKGNNKILNDKYNYILNYINNTNNLMIRYQGLFYYIKKYISKMSINDRNYLYNIMVCDIY